MSDHTRQADESAAAPRSGEPDQLEFSPGYANYVLGVLFIVYVFNFIDRQALAVFIGPIQEEFGASDTAMGLLVGFAFALLYTVAGIPIARLADRRNRRNIIAIGLAVWSAMTIASGLARSFSQLVLARIGVGIGEAAGTPPSHSLIADYFPERRRATALAIYSAAVFAGSGIAYLGGGYLREYFDWRTGFVILGVPGLLFALVVRFTVREPPRGYSEQRRDETVSSFAETLRFLLGSRAWSYLMVGSAFLSITGYGVLMWGYEFYGRVHGMAPIEIGQWMALIVGVGGSIGTVVGGVLADRLTAHRRSLAVSVPALVTLAGTPLGVAFLLADSPSLSLVCFAIFYPLLNIYIPAMYSANQSLARLKMRATASAILLVILNIVGAGAGPFVVGLLSDLMAPVYGVHAIRYALAATMFAGAIGAILIVVASKTFERDTRRVYGGEMAVT